MALSAVTIFIPASLAVFTTPANAVLSIILELARITASIPNASMTIDITLLEMYVMYICFAVAFYLMWNKSGKRLEGNILVQ